MKKSCQFQVLLTFLLSIFLFACEKESDPGSDSDPDLEMVHIPDSVFLQRLLLYNDIDIDNNDTITYAEARRVTRISVRGKTYADEITITSIEGIEAFVNLEALICGHNSITEIDLAKNSKLKALNIADNQLSSIDLSNNPVLEELWVFYNNLQNIDVSKHRRLKILLTHGNSLSSIDVSNNDSLLFLACGGNLLTSIDLSNNSELLILGLNNGSNGNRNTFEHIDLSNNTKLKDFSIGNMELTKLDLSKNTELGKSFALEYLAFLPPTFSHIRSGPGMLSFTEMPNLSEVCVWTVPFPPEGLEIMIIDSPNIIFTTECSVN